jgi:hypothetical protein
MIMMFLLKMLFSLFVVISVSLVGADGTWMPVSNMAGVVGVIIAIVVGNVFTLTGKGGRYAKRA